MVQHDGDGGTLTLEDQLEQLRALLPSGEQQIVDRLLKEVADLRNVKRSQPAERVPETAQSASRLGAGEMPTSVAGELPSETAGEMPTSVAGELPSETAGEMPSDITSNSESFVGDVSEMPSIMPGFGLTYETPVVTGTP